MKSPFPGMDPYLEEHWRDVHHRLCTYACDALQPQIRPALFARIEERLIVESDAPSRSIYPDVKIVEPRTRRSDDVDEGGGGAAVATIPTIAIAEPLIIESPSSETANEGYIEILDPNNGGKLVSVIEFLSLSNKTRGPGFDQYQQKQKELLEAGVSLVEVDLLRGGTWTIQLAQSSIHAKDRATYRVSVHRGWGGRKFEYYPIHLNERLPIIRIPLRQTDGRDATLDLQSLIDQTYTNGAYDSIDYRRPIAPAFAMASDDAWLNDLLVRAKKR